MKLRFKSSGGLILNLIVSILLLMLFFGSVLKSPNTTYFSASGDGLKSTFGSVYHLKYDSTYLRTDYMNYPFGESVFYTGGQPLIINTLKFIKSIGFDFSNHIIGFLNIWMLLSIVLATLFLYLILRELKLPIAYSIFASNIIAFMSPQMDRFGGHFNLAYVFFIPLIIYLFLLFYKNRKLSISILIGLTALYSLGTHVYFFGFFTFLLLTFWTGWIFNNKRNSQKLNFISLHILIQFLLPLILFQAFILISDGANDRTSYPWGFFALTSYLQGVFLPINRSYGEFLQLKSVPWEGIAYIGLIGLFGTISIIYHRIRSTERKTNWNFLKVTDNYFLNILFWASLLALLFSFGLPFTIGMKGLYNYMGPLKNFRAPGRYAWLFFYAINIISFYLLWFYYKRNRKVIPAIILILALILGSYDAYLNVKSQEHYINNKIESLIDTDNKLEINHWIHEIDIRDYQAIISLPHFHIGSENFWIEGSNNIKKQSFIVSMKTGLPMVSVMMGRTSMQQTVQNLQLFMEAYNNYDLLNNCSSKAFLLLIDKQETLSDAERKIQLESRLITQNNHFEFRSITKSDFEKILKKNRNEVFSELKSKLLFKNNGFLTTDSLTNFYYNGIGNNTPLESNIGRSCYHGNIKKENKIEISQLENINTSSEYVISLWIENMEKDMYPRTNLSISLCTKNNEPYYYDEFQIWRKLSVIDSNGWGLVEFKVKFNQTTDIIKINIKNKLLTHGELKIDEILIRPVDTDIYSQSQNTIYKNNRFYSIKKQASLN